jgi:hypothetical protein
MSTAPTPVHRHRAPWDLRFVLAGIALLTLAAILVTLLVDRVSSSSKTPAGTGSGDAARQEAATSTSPGPRLGSTSRSEATETRSSASWPQPT